jgi:integrase
MPLTAREVQTAKPAAKPYGIADGGGLFLWVTADGRKYWHFRFSINGKQPRISLGTSSAISLQQARERAAECRALVANGVDPRNHRRDEKQRESLAQTNTFKAAAEFWYQHKDQAGRAASTLAKIRTYLDKDILPELGNKPLLHITRGDCAKLQERIEKRDAHNVAKKVRGWLKQIFSQAIARGLCENNPASELRSIAAALPKVKHYPHLLEPELPEFLKALDRSTSRLTARVAAWMTLWTASRPGMVRHAEWVDIDFDHALWTVPAAKMKMRRDHVVPLPEQLLAALRELHQLTGRGRYLFPGIGTKHPVLSENTINLVFSKIGYKGRLVGHGTRHTASTLLREHGWTKDHVEAQLSHVEEGVAGDYNQARYLPQRSGMMQWYADYLDALRVGITPAQQIKFEKQVNTIRRS